VHPKFKTKYHVRNWPEYERSLVQRGDVTIWMSPAAVAGWKAERMGRPGGQPKYSAAAIETALTLRLIFHLPLRQAEGFLSSVFAMMGLTLSTPDYTTLCRRGQSLNIRLRRVSTTEPIHLVIDSTGLTMMGEGEWTIAKHGGHGKRRWRKLHLGVDARGVIVAQALTGDDVPDATTGLDLINAVDSSIEKVTADSWI
jgi:hypothetical protein